MKNVREEILGFLQKMPKLPASTSHLLQTINDDNHSLKNVIQVVRHDAVLTGRLLRIINSAAISLQSPVNTVERAIPLLGENLIVGIALAEAAATLQHAELTGYRAHAGELWQHDLRTAIAARKIAAFSKISIQSDLAFTCGLLHDLGKAVISSFLADNFDEVLQQIDDKLADDYLVAEQNLLGTNHAEIGHELAKQWNLPEPLPTVMHWHHQPTMGSDEYRSLLFAVHLGDFIAMMAGYGTGADTLRYSLDNSYPEYITLSPEELAALMVEVEEEFSILQEAFLTR